MIEQFISKIPNAQRNGIGYKSPCPAHDDEGLSLTIRESQYGGGVVLLCNSGCTPAAILKKLGMSAEDAYKIQLSSDIESEIQEAAERLAWSDRDADLPERYFRENGNIYCRDSDRTSFVCSDLSVIATTCDANGDNWGRCVNFCDGRGVQHQHIVPMSMLSGDGAELRARMMDSGLTIAGNRLGRQKFVELFSLSQPERHVRCVNQTGWHDGAFVLPDTVIAADDDPPDLFLQNVDRAVNKYRTCGELSDWQKNIGEFCRKNSRLMFAVNLAFAASILPLSGDTSGGFHLYGTSSTGKTTALLVAGSVWGGDRQRGFLETWRATANGLEATAELHNHSLLLLDEVSQVNPNEIGEVVYSLSNGFGKSRMTKSLTARRKAEWQLLFFSSGERTLDQISRGVGQRVNGGQEARFVNIEADARQGAGLFDSIGPFEKASDLAQRLSTASRTYYGTPIRYFLKQVCQKRSLVQERIQESRQLFNSKQALEGSSGEIFRVASRFALVTAAGILAVDFGIVNWEKAEVIACSERLFNEWIETRGGVGSYDIFRGVRQVLAFIDRHGSSRFQEMDKRTPDFEIAHDFVRDRAGFKRSVNGLTEYLILPDIFDNEICQGGAPTAIAKELERQGYLIRGSEPNCLQSRETLPGLGRKRVYIVIPQGITEKEDASDVM